MTEGNPETPKRTKQITGCVTIKRSVVSVIMLQSTVIMIQALFKKV